MSYDPNLPFCCIECAQLYTVTYYQQSLETFLLSHSGFGQINTNVDPIAPISVKGPDAGSSKPVSRPRHTTLVPETNISRNSRDDPSISTTRSPRNPRKSGEPQNGIEYNPSTSSLPAQDPLPSNRQNRRETGVSNSANKPRKPNNDDLPPIPTQYTLSSNGGPQPQKIRDIDKPQAHVGPLSIPPVRTDERNQSNYAQIRPHTRERRVSFSANNPQDSDHAEPPSVPIKEKTQSNFSQTHSQTQETEASNKTQGHIESPSVPIQEKSRSNFSQPQEIQASSSVNNSRDHAERSKASIPTQDQGQDRSVSDASKTDTRPHLIHGTPSQMDTQYVSMLLALDDMPKLHNMLAKFFNWILLAGFVLFPGTFTSLKNLGGSGQVEQQLVHAVTSIPL